MAPKIAKKTKKKFKANPTNLADPDDISFVTDPILVRNFIRVIV